MILIVKKTYAKNFQVFLGSKSYSITVVSTTLRTFTLVRRDARVSLLYHRLGICMAISRHEPLHWSLNGLPNTLLN